METRHWIEAHPTVERLSATLDVVHDPADARRLRVRKRARSGPEALALVREAEALSRLDHAGVRALVPSVPSALHLDPEAPLLLLEHVRGVPLDAYLAAHPGGALACFVSLARALVHVHARGLAHGDLKPANVLVDDEGVPRLIDFGLSGSHGAVATGGTRTFMPPEHERGGALTPASDLFSLARTFEVACPKLPPELARVLPELSRPDARDRPANVDGVLLSLGERSYARDRRGSLPLVGCSSLLDRARDTLTRDAGASLAIVGARGAGATRVALELARGERATVLASLADGHDPFRELAPRWLPASEASSGAELRAARVAVAAARRGMALVLDDARDADEDGRARLVAAARALASEGSGALVLVGCDERLSEGLQGAGAAAAALPDLDLDQCGQLFECAEARVSAAVRRAAWHGATGRAGAVAELAYELAVDPRVDPTEVQRRARERCRAEQRSAGSTLGPEAALAAARRALASGAPRRAAEALRSGFEEPSRAADETVELLARACAAAGELAEAVTLFSGLSRQSLSGASAHVQALERLGRYDEAVDRGLPWLERSEATRRPEFATLATAVASAALASGAMDRASSVVAAVLHLDAEPSLRAQVLLVRSDIALRSARADDARADAEAALAAIADHGEPALIAQANSRLGSVGSLGGDPRGAKRYHQLALDAALETGDVATLPPYLLNLATAEHATFELGSAIAHYEEAAGYAERLGRQAMRAAALTNLGGLLSVVGATSEAAKVLEQAGAAAREAGSSIYAAQGTLLRAELSSVDQPALARAPARQAKSEFEACGAHRQALEARLLSAELHSDRDATAAADFVRSEAGALADAGLGARSRLLAARLCVRAGRLEAGLAAAEEAAVAAAQHDDRELEGRALLELAAIHERLGTGGSAGFVARAREAFGHIAARLPAGLRERFLADPRRRLPTQPSRAVVPVASLGDGGRRLLGLVRRALLDWDERRVLALAIDEAVALTGAERAFLLRRSDSGRARDEVVVARNLDGETIRRTKKSFSRSVAERVLSTGQCVVTAMATDDPELGGAKSILDLGLRSILCVPVRGPGGVTGALYLDHRFHEGRFGDGERELVQALADIIGLALENGRLHREAKERERELERAHARLSREGEAREVELTRLRDRLSRGAESDPADNGGIVGRSPALHAALTVASKVAASELPVLIEGESGTGKELFARYVHSRSLRSGGPLLTLNCGAVPEALLESELFGHVRGAFTGALRDHAGLFRACEGGTLLLDEIGEMPARMQTRLLRVLQEREVRPVGAPHTVPVDVRVVAATNRDLEADVEAGRFRRDLYFRLVGVRLALPALRERLEDIPQLAEVALAEIADEPGMRAIGLSRSALARLVSHDWPGNVRELFQVLRRAVLVADGDEIRREDLALGSAPTGRREALRRFDRDLIEDALRAADGNKSAAARALGVSRVTLYRHIERHGL